MKQDPVRYVAEWWVPAPADPDINTLYFNPDGMLGFETKHTGVLTYDGEEIELELFKVRSKLPITHYHQYSVMWGEGLDGNIFTLFSLGSKDWTFGGWTNIKYRVKYVVIGQHILKPDEAFFTACIVQFPYLRNWLFHNNLSFQQIGGIFCCSLDITNAHILAEQEVKHGVKWMLKDNKTSKHTIPYDVTITQWTEFIISAPEGLPLLEYIRHIREFSQFLSIALYREQYPSRIQFFKKGGDSRFELLFEKSESTDPGILSMIKFDVVKEKLPSMLSVWHENYDRVSPISSYLIQSFRRKSIFEVPDFLILAQALDGYHKRFVNKIDGKNHKKYEDGIDALLKDLKGVECVERCHIDTKVLSDSRNKYSHLFPDEEISKAVDGRELLWLTKKCQVLLTCCLMKMLGMSNDEINQCYEKSPIQNMMDAAPFEFEK